MTKHFIQCETYTGKEGESFTSLCHKGIRGVDWWLQSCLCSVLCGSECH